MIFLLAFSPSLLVLILLLAITCGVGNLSSPAISAWQMDIVPKGKRASITGILGTLSGIGLIVGSVIGGWLWSISIPDPTLPFGVAALLSVASLPICLILEEPKKRISRT